MDIPLGFHLHDNPGEQILFECAANRDHNLQDILRIASSKQINLIEVRNSQLQTLLHVAAGFGRSRLTKYLIEKGADVNAQDREGQAPLHYASNHAHKNIANLLIQAGAQVNLADLRGWTPLLFVVSRKENEVRIRQPYWDVVELLLACGANPFLPKDTNRNCFSRMRSKDQRLEVRLAYLINKLKDLDDSDEVLRESIIDKYLRIQDFFDLLDQGDDGDGFYDLIEGLITKRLINSSLATFSNITPLHRAAGHGRLKVAKLLIRCGANVNAEDDFGRTPLYNAVCHSHIDMITLLCKEGSDINQMDSEGFTPLHLAAKCKTVAACLELIAQGANLTITNKFGLTPFDLAEVDDIQEVLKIISYSDLRPTAEDRSEFIIPEDMQPSDENLIRLCSEKQSSIEQDEIKRLVLSEMGWRYQYIKKKMFETIGEHSDDLSGSFSGYNIASIELILHGKAWLKYQNICKELVIDRGIINEKLLFHGSSTIDRIVMEGFDIRYANRNGMFGAGLYFAEHSSKSNQYTFGMNKGCQEHKEKYCYICERKMILTLVALGRCKKTKEELQDLIRAPPNYYSVAGEPGPNLRYPEYAIYDNRQAYPLFVIKYRLKP